MAETIPIAEGILQHLDDRSAFFVFPSAVPATFWAQWAAETTGKPVALERFIAWDDFKAQALSPRLIDQVPANQISRTLFLADLLRQNSKTAQGGQPIFEELIPPAFAVDYGPFLESLVKILPTLGLLMPRLNQGAPITDPYFKDLRVLFDRYSDFMARFGLFEPDWSFATYTPSEQTWILFFPELIEDWSVYRDLLENQNNLRIIPVPHTLDSRSTKTYQFSSAPEEVRWVALYVKELLEKENLNPQDIVLSVADLRSYTDRLELEFSLRDIPLDFRMGKSLLDYSAGRIFSSFQACPTSFWSYQALKDLLLDHAYPWKHQNEINGLMNFGLTFRCVSGFTENGTVVDVWEKTFERVSENLEEIHFPLSSIKRFYTKLKRDILGIVKPKDFEDLRKKLLYFKSDYFDLSTLSDTSEKIWTRSMEELAGLDETAQRFPDLSLPNPFGLFLTHLRSVTYVYQSGRPGVPVYNYRVAAGIHPRIHILLNMSQDDATVKIFGSSFLREDRKLLLGFADTDLSEAFFFAYGASADQTLWTVSDKNFSGSVVPHRLLLTDPFPPLRKAADIPPLPDPLEEESRLALGITEESASVAPSSLQRRGWEAATIVLAPPQPMDLRKTPLDAAELKEALKNRLLLKKESFRITPTDLNLFQICPFSWLLNRGLKIEEKQTVIETINQRELGTLYHAILEALFNRIKQEDERFFGDRVDHYEAFLDEEIEGALRGAEKSEGAFQESVYGMLKARIRSTLRDFLRDNTLLLDQARILSTELYLSFPYSLGDFSLLLEGRADIALLDSQDRIILIDYKTQRTPGPRELVPDRSDFLQNLQMAAYIKMIEAQEQKSVETAVFYSLENRKPQLVVSPRDKPNKRSILPLRRGDYQNAVDQVDRVVTRIIESLDQGSYPILPLQRRSLCALCTVTDVCRIPFSGGDRK